MKKKITLLIITSILGVIALSFIQGYLINNTYKLKKESFIEDTEVTISRFDIDINSVDFEPLYDVLYEYLVLRISEYKLNGLEKTELLSTYQNVKDSINTAYIQAYKNEFKRRGITYKLKFQKRLKSIVVLESSDNDTLYFKSDNSKMQHLLGEDFNPSDGYVTNNSKIQTDYSTDYIGADGEWQNLSFDFEVTSENLIIAEDWNRIVLGQMTGLFILSIFIFILVIGLLYYSINNLITQKKIADIKTDFVNNITHEFKTPLATLSLATKMLEKEELKSQPEIMESTIKTVNRQSGRLQKLIDQVLDNSLGAEDIKLNKVPLEVSDYINNVLDDFLLSVKDKSIELTRDINSDIIIHIDKFYFTTALLNILENAIKYTQGNPKVHCKLSTTATHLTVSISDNGIGISEPHKTQIFDKFFRANQSEVHNVKGLGLGLFYTNEIIKAHHGNINIDSQLSKGSTFNITIPLDL